MNLITHPTKKAEAYGKRKRTFFSNVAQTPDSEVSLKAATQSVPGVAFTKGHPAILKGKKEIKLFHGRR